jgi:hypothetical protein
MFSGAANSASHAGNSAIDKIKSEGSSLVNSLTHGVSGAVGDIETILIVAAIGIAFLLFKGGETVYHGAQEGAQFIKDNGATIAKDAVQLAPLALL